MVSSASSFNVSTSTTSASCNISSASKKFYQDTTTQKKNQKRRRNLYAMKLNNSAAMCIEVGLHDRAISSLSKALQLSEQLQQQQENDDDNDDDDEMSCPCYCCTMDGCIEYSEKNSHLLDNDPFSLVESAIDSTGDSGSYIYRRPIQVSPHSIKEGHNMGSTLCLIIAFNLALAYNLKAISMYATSSNGKDKTRHYKYMTVALKLYTQVLRWQTRLIRENYYHDSSLSSTSASFSNMRFKMILFSNMSQIHRSCGMNDSNNNNNNKENQKNKKSYQMCMELLLSNIMFVVEYKTRIFNNSDNSSSSMSLPYIMTANLERFLQNTSPLLMSSSRSKSGVQDQCASAA